MKTDTLVQIFDRLFGNDYQTCLAGGADEPLYETVPACISTIHFRNDFVSSALHEVAHWCIAGDNRRPRTGLRILVCS